METTTINEHIESMSRTFNGVSPRAWSVIKYRTKELLASHIAECAATWEGDASGADASGWQVFGMDQAVRLLGEETLGAQFQRLSTLTEGLSRYLLTKYYQVPAGVYDEVTDEQIEAIDTLLSTGDVRSVVGEVVDEAVRRIHLIEAKRAFEQFEAEQS
ncbi:hypothetical protein [Corynebacterium riegelii]